MPTQGPFPRDIYTHPPVVTEYEQISGNGGPEIPYGSTAQNNYKPLKWVRCKKCSEVIKQSDIQYHTCPDSPLDMYLNDYDDDAEYYDDDDLEDEEDDLSDGRTY